MSTLTSEATFTVVPSSLVVADFQFSVLPAWPVQSGRGRLVHPVLGSFDYEYKPDEWVNIDGDVIIPPIWASTKTLGGAANVLWNGYLRDVVVIEKWKALGGLAMPISQMRMLYMIWTNPVDPVIGYVHWYPNYISPLGFKVIPLDLKAGGDSGITFDDVVNYLGENDTPNGWMVNPVTLTLKIVDRL